MTLCNAGYNRRARPAYLASKVDPLIVQANGESVDPTPCLVKGYAPLQLYAQAQNVCALALHEQWSIDLRHMCQDVNQLTELRGAACFL